MKHTEAFLRALLRNITIFLVLLILNSTLVITNFWFAVLLVIAITVSAILQILESTEDV